MNPATYYEGVGQGVGLKVEFEHAHSFEELYDMLKKAGKIKGLIRTYRAPELIELIESVRCSNGSINKVPQANGLQKAVMRLTDVEDAPVEL